MNRAEFEYLPIPAPGGPCGPGWGPDCAGPDAGLAKDGEPLPSGITETAESFAVEWTGTYRITGEAMVFTEAGRERVILGYPVTEIERAIRRMRAAG